MGSACQQLGDLSRSIEYFEKVLEIVRKLGDRQGESVVLTNMGGIYSDLSDDRRAIQYLEQSLAIESEIGDRHAQMASFNNLANAYRNLGNATRAFEYYNKSLDIALGMSDRRGEAFALNNIGSTYANLGNLETALKYHEQALEIFKEIGDRHSEGFERAETAASRQPTVAQLARPESLPLPLHLAVLSAVRPRRPVPALLHAVRGAAQVGPARREAGVRRSRQLRLCTHRQLLLELHREHGQHLPALDDPPDPLRPDHRGSAGPAAQGRDGVAHGRPPALRRDPRRRGAHLLEHLP